MHFAVNTKRPTELLSWCILLKLSSSSFNGEVLGELCPPASATPISVWIINIFQRLKKVARDNTENCQDFLEYQKKTMLSLYGPAFSTSLPYLLQCSIFWPFLGCPQLEAFIKLHYSFTRSATLAPGTYQINMLSYYPMSLEGLSV